MNIKKFGKQGIALLLGVVLALQTPADNAWNGVTAYAYTERSATVNASSLNVRSGPGTGYSSLAKLSSGAAVTVIDETTGSDGKLWYQIRYTYGGSQATGYVLSTYVKFPVSYTYSGDFESQLSAQGFPESYKTALRELHAQYPNWVFETYQTGLDWNTVIENESVLGRNLVGTGSVSSWKSTADGAFNWDDSTWTGFDGSDWVAASEEIICYYMDPRNFLDSVNIFQFLNHNYEAALQTREGLAQLVQGTFLTGSVIYNGSGSGSTSSGSSSSGGPGASGSSQQSSGVITSPSGGRGGTGSGSTGSGSSSDTSTSGPGVSSSPGGVSSGVLSSPSASISRHDAPLVSTSVEIGVRPGSDSSTSSGSTNSSSGSSGTSGSPTVTTGSGTSGSPSSGSSSTSASSPSSSGSSSTGSSSPTVTAGSGSSAVTTVSPSSGTTVTTGDSSSSNYIDLLMQSGSQYGVNPYVLAAMIIQEQGTDGSGSSISGTVSGYEGYYNYFNIGAYAANGLTAVQRGLWYASQSGSYGLPWNTPEKSIAGGTQFYGEIYVGAGQDTFYLKKFNVQGENIYKHQYMTNISAAASEASLFAEGYSQYLQSATLRFKIPVYQNMPDTACAKPTIDGSPNNKLSSLGVDGFTLTPTFSRDTTSYDVIVDSSVTSVTVYASAIDSTAALSGVGTVYLSDGTNQLTVNVTAENGSVRSYVIRVTRQSGGASYDASLGGNTSGSSTIVIGGTSSGSVTSASPSASGTGSGSGSTTSSSPVITSGASGSGSSTGSTTTGSTTSSSPVVTSGSGPGSSSTGSAAGSSTTSSSPTVTGGSSSSGSGSGVSASPTPGGSNVTIVQ
ncbi:MAG: SH3 domain-containing protein [Clostridiales bacterium]|nr:SH3 domain-containing protein [Clostridiales bacterium]